MRLVLCLLLLVTARVQAVETYAVDLKAYKIPLPAAADPELRRLLTSPETIFFKIPQAMQHWIPPERVRLVDTDRPYVWAVYRKGVFGELNSNVKFPWETTVGLNTSFKEKDTPYHTVDLLNLPTNSAGQVIPVLVLNEAPVKWFFPPGTTVGELIYVTYEGQNYIQEIRTRQKTADQTEWKPRLYRPVRDQKEFAELTGLRPNYVPAKAYHHFRNPHEDEVFRMEGYVDRLPAISTELVKTLLQRPFQDVTEDHWSPAADQPFHILPKDYCFGVLTVDNVTCANCHRQTQITTHNLLPKEPVIRRNPDKDTSIRGCDSVFTWHPFDSDTLRESPTDTKQLQFRSYDLERKTIRVVKAGTSVPGYKLTKFVEDSLKPYELPRTTSYLHEPRRANPEEETWMRAPITRTSD